MPDEWHTLRAAADGVVLLDQTRLPSEEIYRTCTSVEEVATAIEGLVVRGAPAIACAAALGMALAARSSRATNVDELAAEVEAAADRLAKTRPTGVNLFWAIDRMRGRLREVAPAGELEAVREALVEEADRILLEDVAANRALGEAGVELVPDVPNGACVLTHCNAGALATSGHGTALGVVRSAVASGRKLRVFADETRPFLQGARLTAWELVRDEIPVTVVTDGMAGHLMYRGEVDLVLVGADRIAANGDVANKIGTYTLAVLARENGIPFYVAAPVSTIDFETPDGDAIPIEERSSDEVLRWHGTRLAPEAASARHPAFDVTPARLVTAIVSDRGIVRPPYLESLAALRR